MIVAIGSNTSTKRYAGADEILKRYQGANLIWQNGPAIESPITAAIEPKNHLAFGFDRLVEGFTGNTVRLRNNDTLAEQDFGASSNGLFNISAALAFASNLDVVKFYSQDADAKELTPTGTIAFARGGVIQRQQIEANLTGANAGFITPDNTSGLSACDIDGGGTNFLECTNAAIPSQCEIHILHSHKTRKNINTSPEAEDWGATHNTEAVYSMGAAGSGANFTTYITNRLAGGSLFVRRVASNVSTTLPKYNSRLKQWAPLISTIKLEDTKTSLWINGDRSNSEVGTTGASVDAEGIATGGATAGDSAVTRQYFRIGRQINGPVGEANTQANILFSGVIITAPLTNRERLTLHSNWANMCQAHVLQNETYAHDLFTDYVLFGKASSGATPLAGEKGQYSIQFNTSEYESETPSWGYGHVSASGLKGLRNALLNSRANQFEDVGVAKVGGQERTLTVVSVFQDHPTISSGPDLVDMFAYASGTALRPAGQQIDGLDLQVAKDHNAFSFNTVARNGIDANGLTGRPGPTDPHCVTSTPTLYNGVNHPFFYRKKTMHRDIEAETDTAYTCNTGTTLASAKAWMATEDEGQHSQQGEYGVNLSLEPNRTYLMIQRIKPHPDFVEVGTQNEIDAFIRKATKSSVIVPLNGPCVGFYDGFHAQEIDQGATRVPNTGSRLVAHGDDYLNAVGNRIMIGVIPSYIADEDIPKLVTSVRRMVNAVT